MVSFMPLWTAFSVPNDSGMPLSCGAHPRSRLGVSRRGLEPLVGHVQREDSDREGSNIERIKPAGEEAGWPVNLRDLRSSAPYEEYRGSSFGSRS